MNDLENFPDPRAQTLTTEEGVTRLQGWWCTKCEFALALEAPWCPKCRGDLRHVESGPRGIVWSSTVVRVALPGRTPPYVLVYVDLAEGPRVLGHFVAGASERVAVGTPVRLVQNTGFGDLAFEMDKIK